jgi:hypothetical protein
MISDIGTSLDRLPIKIALKKPNLEVYGIDLLDATIEIAE